MEDGMVQQQYRHHSLKYCNQGVKHDYFKTHCQLFEHVGKKNY